MRFGAVLALERLALATAFIAAAGLLAVAIAYDQVVLAIVVAALPLAVVLAGALKGQPVILVVALGWGIVGGFADQSLPLSSSVQVYPADLILGLAFLSWLMSSKPSVVSGRLVPFWAVFVVFALTVLAGTIRGYENYDASLVGQPLRLILYAGIVAVVLRADPTKLFSALTVFFYAGTVWEFFTAIYHIATGTSQTTTSELLSTGGSRVLSLEVSLYLAGAFFLALLNLSGESSSRRRLLHGTMAVLALFGIVVAFGRGTFVGVLIGLVVLAAVSGDLRRMLLRLSPVLVPLLILGALGAARAFPELTETFANRVNPAVSNDSTVRWRAEANRAVLEQVREDPVFGVGFGRGEKFIVDGLRYSIPQNPHNDYIYLLAGAGIVGLGSFLVLCLLSFREAWRCFRRATSPHERRLVLWAGLTLFTFLLNGLAEPLLTFASFLLTVWVLLLVPFAIGAHMDAEASAETRPA